MTELADIFQQHGGTYLDKYGSKILPSHKRAIWDISDCRTEALGGHLNVCNNCSGREYSYHSCKNRACPKCHGTDTEKWLDKRSDELVAAPYFHAVFTIPQELRQVVRSHQKVLYGVLMKAAGAAIIKLSQDPKYVGGKIGMLAVLHTWTNALAYHPHAHFLIPGGGVSSDGRWVPSKEKFLVPTKALSPIYRAKFLEMAQDALPCLQIPKEVWLKDWVVYCKPTIQGASRVLQYLGRYVHRIAITNSRILSITSDQVTFRYKQAKKQKKRWKRSWKTMSLPVHQFMSRFLQHVPPKGFHKVRYYGLLSSTNRSLLRQVQLALAKDADSVDLPTAKEDRRKESGHRGRKCNFCGNGHMVSVMVLSKIRVSPQERAPP